MTAPFVQDADFTLYVGDALEVLAELPAESVHMCVTSPPFFGLRDYGTGTWKGGDPDCDHKAPKWSATGAASSTLAGTAQNHEHGGWKDSCGRCGARRVDRQIGLEASPDEWVTRLVDVFREVRRVLRQDGTLWLEIGDSYSGSGPSGASYQSETTKRRQNVKQDGAFRVSPSLSDRGLTYAEKKPVPAPGTKPKDLVGAPWLLAFALRADGWYLRSDIIEEVEFYCPCGCGHILEERIWRWSQDRDLIWKRPNPMPESVRDRPTKSHSYVFLLSKGPRYFFDQEAVREPMAPESESRYAYAFGGKKAEALAEADKDGVGVRTRTVGMRTFPGSTAEDDAPTLGDLPPEAPRGPDGRRKTTVQQGGHSIQHRDGERWPNGGRNLRSVWTIATEPLPDEHYAAYPQKLVERCILAGTSERGCCPECGAPWERVVERALVKHQRILNPNPAGLGGNQQGQNRAEDGHIPGHYDVTTTGWRQTCECGKRCPVATCTGCRYCEAERERVEAGPAPCVVLDPFLGSGTTALVARRHGRHAIGIELSPAYAAMAARRLQQLSLLA